MNAISRFFVQLARQMKHNPDGITESGLTKGMTKLLDRFVASGALVAPRDPDADGYRTVCAESYAGGIR